MCHNPTLKRDFVENTRIICSFDPNSSGYLCPCIYEEDEREILECIAYKEGLYPQQKSNGPLQTDINCEYRCVDNKTGVEIWRQPYGDWLSLQYNKLMVKTISESGYETFEGIDRQFVKRTRMKYAYKGHFVRACKNCNDKYTKDNNDGRNVFGLDDLKCILQTEFAENIKTYSISNVVLTSWK